MNRQRQVLASGFAILAIGMLAGCTGTQQRHLLVSEVASNALELYLNEPASNQLTLGAGYYLTFSSGTAAPNSIDLSVFGGNMAGGTFLVIWEESGYQGAPVAEQFSRGQTGRVPGIKVADGVLDGFRTAPSEVRLTGTHNRVSGLLAIFPLFKTDTIDDVVRFGLPETGRPSSGGTFVMASGTDLLPNPSGSVHLQRKWNGTSGPLDTDSETDWVGFGQSWGVPTP